MFKTILFLIFITPLVSIAQKIQFNGQVLDRNSGKEIEFASIKLMDPRDSSVLTGTNTDALGKFLFLSEYMDSALIQIKFIGFEPTFKKIILKNKGATISLGQIYLNPIQQLNEVVLSQELEVLKAGIDKKIYNVSEDLTVKGGSANDILNRLPSVEIDQEGNVLLRGEGRVTILIDGKQSSMSGGNGETLLDAIPAGSIDRIEIVTNPSAKYDPDGTSGIINIVLKKNKIKGFNLFYSTNLGSGNLKNGNSAESNLGIAYRNGIVNVYGSYNLSYYEGYRNNFSETNQINSDGTIFRIVQNRIGADLNSGHTFKTGIDFSFDENNEMSLSLSGMIGRRNRRGDLWNSLFDENNNRNSLWQRLSYDPSQSNNYDVDLFYKNTFYEKRGELTFNVHQSFGLNNVQGFYEENYYSTDSISLGVQPLQQQLFNTQINNIFSSQLDFSLVFPELKGRMESGIKMIQGTQGVNTFSERYDTLQNIYVSDTLADFDYSYEEKIYSIYALFGQQWGKFKYQGGLRGEIAYQIPNLISENILIQNPPYINLFPSAHLRYQLRKNSELSFGYSKRINRPSSRNMNPFTNYSDPFNLRRGNPYLKPEYVDSYDLAWILDEKKVTFSLSTYYRYSKGVISRIKEYYDDNTSAATYMNIAKTHGLGTELFATFKLTQFLKITSSWNGNYIWYFAENNNELNRSGYYHNFKINSSIDFWNKSASIQVSHVYNGKRITLQGIAQRKGPTDIAFEKKFQSSKWSLGARVSDIFNVQGFYLNVQQPEVTQVSNYKWLTRRYYLSVTYKFGKVDKKIEQKVTSASGSE